MPSTVTTRPDASTEGPAEDGGDVGDGGTFVEKALTIDVALAVTASAPDGGLAAHAGAGLDAGGADGGRLRTRARRPRRRARMSGALSLPG